MSNPKPPLAARYGAAFGLPGAAGAKAIMNGAIRCVGAGDDDATAEVELLDRQPRARQPAVQFELIHVHRPPSFRLLRNRHPRRRSMMIPKTMLAFFSSPSPRTRRSSRRLPAASYCQSAERLLGIISAISALGTFCSRSVFGATMFRNCFFQQLSSCLSILVLGIGQCLAGESDGPAASKAATASVLSLAQEQEDFDLMRQALEEAHSGLYRYSTKMEMDRTFSNFRAKLAPSMPDFAAVLAGMLAQIKCGHTRITPDEQTLKGMREGRLFPLRVSIEGKRLYVVLNETPDDSTIHPGIEIVKINDKSVTEILDRILPTVPGDGDVETGKWESLQNDFPRLYRFLVEPAEEFTIEVRDDSGKTVLTKLAGVTAAERRKNKNPVNASIEEAMNKIKWWRGNLALRFLKDPDIAEIHIGGFAGNDFAKWIEKTFKTLHDKGTKTLVLDLRDNHGGEDMDGAMLVSYLTDKPFRYFDHIDMKSIKPSFKAQSDWKKGWTTRLGEGATPIPSGGFRLTAKVHPGVLEQKPGKYPFLGKVFVLTNGGTFSTAADFCAVTHHLKRATFVGKETGGAYYGNNSGLATKVTLPNSKLQVVIQTFEYWNAVPGYPGTRRGVIPDHPIENKLANLLRGTDDQLEFATKLASKSEK
jgi:C-terminal processing protease CtpA/Prc